MPVFILRELVTRVVESRVCWRLLDNTSDIRENWRGCRNGCRCRHRNRWWFHAEHIVQNRSLLVGFLLQLAAAIFFLLVEDRDLDRINLYFPASGRPRDRADHRASPRRGALKRFLSVPRNGHRPSGQNAALIENNDVLRNRNLFPRAKRFVDGALRLDGGLRPPWSCQIVDPRNDGCFFIVPDLSRVL